VIILEDQIGELAGEVWDHLESEGENSLSAITDAVDAPRSRVNMALGWLACEGKPWYQRISQIRKTFDIPISEYLYVFEERS
jgi:hypothetical protein